MSRMIASSAAAASASSSAVRASGASSTTCRSSPQEAQQRGGPGGGHPRRRAGASLDVMVPARPSCHGETTVTSVAESWRLVGGHSDSAPRHPGRRLRRHRSPGPRRRPCCRWSRPTRSRSSRCGRSCSRRGVIVAVWPSASVSVEGLPVDAADRAAHGQAAAEEAGTAARAPPGHRRRTGPRRRTGHRPRTWPRPAVPGGCREAPGGEGDAGHGRPRSAPASEVGAEGGSATGGRDAGTTGAAPEPDGRVRRGRGADGEIGHGRVSFTRSEGRRWGRAGPPGAPARRRRRRRRRG